MWCCEILKFPTETNNIKASRFLRSDRGELVAKPEWHIFEQIAKLTKGFLPHPNEGMFPPPPDDDIYDGIDEEDANDG